MKYLNAKDMPCYRYMREEDTPEANDNRVGLMEIEAEEMLYTGEMKELLWIKCLDEEEYKQLMRDEADARMKKLDELNEIWEKVLENSWNNRQSTL